MSALNSSLSLCCTPSSCISKQLFLPPTPNDRFPHFPLTSKLLGKKEFTPEDINWWFARAKICSIGFSLYFLKKVELVIKRFKNWVSINEMQRKIQILASLEKLENLPSPSAFLYGSSWQSS